MSGPKERNYYEKKKPYLLEKGCLANPKGFLPIKK